MRMNNKDKWIVFKKKWIDNQKNNKDTNIQVNNKNNQNYSYKYKNKKDKKKKGNVNRDRDNKVYKRKNKEFKII